CWCVPPPPLHSSGTAQLPCRGGDGTRTTGLPISLHERALSATGLSYARRRVADMVLLTPTTTHDESMGTCTGRTAPPHIALRWALTPDAHDLVRALPLASTMALRFS